MNAQTLGAAKDEALEALKDYKAELKDPQEFNDWLLYGGMKYPTPDCPSVEQQMFELKDYKKPRAMFWARIERNEHGTYEVNAYVS